MLNRISVWVGALALAVVLVAPVAAEEIDAPTVVYFYREGCPECAIIGEVLTELAEEYPHVVVARHDAGTDAGAELQVRLGTGHGVLATNTPQAFVGHTVISGGNRAAELRLREAFEACAAKGCPSPMPAAGEDAPAFNWQWFAIAATVSLLFLVLAVIGPK